MSRNPLLSGKTSPCPASYYLLQSYTIQAADSVCTVWKRVPTDSSPCGAEEQNNPREVAGGHGEGVRPGDAEAPRREAGGTTLSERIIM